MKHLIHDVRLALAGEGWYSALALALSLPDACASFDQRPGRTRYIEWAKQFVVPHFTAANGKVFLTGEELYRFRCAFLHANDFSPDQRNPQAPDDGNAMFEVLNHVFLYVSESGIVPGRGMASSPHSTPPTRQTSYSTSVETLCGSICLAVESWLSTASNEVLARVEKMHRIVRIDSNFDQTPI